MKRPSRRAGVLAGVGVALALFVAVQVADGNDVIDLPAWANIKGVDVPLIGNTDELGCKLSGVDGEDLVEIRIVDGDETTYPDFAHVWRNNRLLTEDEIDRRSVDVFVVPGVRGEEQFYSISMIPERSDRTYCASITP